MTEEKLLRLLELFASEVKRTQVKYPMEIWGNFDEEWRRSIQNAFEEVKSLTQSLQYLGDCERPFSEELPKEKEFGWVWRIFCCRNHVHILHLSLGEIILNLDLAEKIIVLGFPR